VAQVVEALRYKSEGPRFDFQWCHWNFSGRIIALGLTQTLTEMSIRIISWGVKVAGAQGWNPLGLSRPVMEQLFLSLIILNTM